MNTFKILSNQKLPAKINLFWFRRDLRLDDNHGLYKALCGGLRILPVFIFDQNILEQLENPADKRVQFIYQNVLRIKEELETMGSSLAVFNGRPENIFVRLADTLPISAVYTNHDYEPYAIQRDRRIQDLLSAKNILFHSFKDQVIFEKEDVLNSQGRPYTVFTPYKNAWLKKLTADQLSSFPSETRSYNILPVASLPFPELSALGFKKVVTEYPAAEINPEIITGYHKTRDLPAMENGTSRLGIHLRFGTISLRRLVNYALQSNEIFLSELVWREFFMMILWNFPQVVDQPFNSKYAGFKWLTDEEGFRRWCNGTTGYPLVDAGMRQLNATGYMHNRVRMVTAGFLTKHLLIDWRRGERYFAGKLLDFELASNNGNWQWAAGCGCDAAPYFRIFNPETQQKKFDPNFEYIRHWIREFGTAAYPHPMIQHKYARERALAYYKNAL